jgi:hypothetical protein
MLFATRLEVMHHRWLHAEVASVVVDLQSDGGSDHKTNCTSDAALKELEADLCPPSRSQRAWSMMRGRDHGLDSTISAFRHTKQAPNSHDPMWCKQPFI